MSEPAFNDVCGDCGHPYSCHLPASIALIGGKLGLMCSHGTWPCPCKGWVPLR